MERQQRREYNQRREKQEFGEIAQSRHSHGKTHKAINGAAPGSHHSSDTPPLNMKSRLQSVVVYSSR
jgi:hypothetical protein